LAFVGGLALAWFGEWETADLIWSLWLSSLVVGYALIVWNLSSPLRAFGVNVASDGDRGRSWVGGGLVLGVGFLCGLAFFTMHFGGFHFVHSVFLASFFPVTPGTAEAGGFPDFADYVEVCRRYWIFLPVAFLAERTAFVADSAPKPEASVTAESIDQRKRRARKSGLMAPYANVVRMHLLIFFFAAVHFAKLENFAVYTVVYAVYFFPWRMLRRDQGEADLVDAQTSSNK
jgi:hypothetical protein